MRRALVDRRTTETRIVLSLVLEGRGRYDVATGIRFLDHMLELFARHGGFDLRVKADGDLDVDQHHTVEDLGIALGEAVLKAVGNKRGINRAGYFVMPMDETLAVAAIDLSGRPHTVVDLKGDGRTGRRSADRARSRLLRGIRERRPRERPCEGDVRTVEPSQSRSGIQGIRPRASRRLRARPPPRADAAVDQGPAVIPIALIDYRAGNLTSVKKALAAVGAEVFVPGSPAEIDRARGVVVPGVGHFGATTAIDRDWIDAIQALVANGRPLLGICLGMQWLYEGSDEAPTCPGLGVLSRPLLTGSAGRRPRNA